ncbi:MAG: hypothetical protein QXY40_04115 [Candidatus Methanomethylicia archaeon]
MAAKFRHDIIEPLCTETLEVKGRIHGLLIDIRNGNDVDATYKLGTLKKNVENLRYLYSSISYWTGKDMKLWWSISDCFHYMLDVIDKIKSKLVEGKVSDREIKFLERIANIVAELYDSTYNYVLGPPEDSIFIGRNKIVNCSYVEVVNYTPPKISEAAEKFQEILKEGLELFSSSN